MAVKYINRKVKRVTTFLNEEFTITDNYITGNKI